MLTESFQVGLQMPSDSNGFGGRWNSENPADSHWSTIVTKTRMSHK